MCGTGAVEEVDGSGVNAQEPIFVRASRLELRI
jgi:hypothetical protein